MGITTSGDNRGVHGHTNSTTGTGVYGTATSQSTGLNYGVRGVSISSNGRGVDGRATAATRGLGYRLTDDEDADAADRAPLLDELPLR